MASLVTKVCAAVLLASAATAFPVSISDFQKHFEIVEGPKELLVPFDSVKDALGTIRKPKNADGEVVDSDYVVYGKYYLMKAKPFGIADRRHSDLDNKNSLAGNLADKLNIKSPPSLKDESVNEGTYEDAIAFPARSEESTKRPYRFHSKNTGNMDMKNHHGPNHGQIRKIEERSAPEQRGTTTESTTEAFKSTVEKFSTTESADQDSTTGLDKEALELLQTLLPQSTQGGIPKRDAAFTTKTPDAGTVFNTDKDTFDISNRFLIHVPNKTNLTAECPEGQKRAHRGICKPVFVHNPSPQDGMYAGKITVPNFILRKAQSNSNNNNNNPNRNLELIAVFRSFIELEKRLQKSIQSAERQLHGMVHNIRDTSSNTSSTPKLINQQSQPKLN